MPFDALKARRLGAISLGVLALHVLLLDRALDAFRFIAAPAPNVWPAAVQLRAPAPPVVALAEPPAAAIAMAPTPPPPQALRALARERGPSPAAPRVFAPVEVPPPRAPVVPSMAEAAAAVPPPAMADSSALRPDALPAASVAADLPIYRTRLAPAFAFGYDLHRGAASGTGELHWQPQEGGYQARLTSSGGGAPTQEWSSVGGFDTAGLAPTRYTDRRRGRGALAANFQRDAGKVTYSGPAVEHTLPPGAQDRLSWMLQLAAIAAADPSLIGPGGRVSFLVVGARGDAEVWSFIHIGEEALTLPDGMAQTVRLLREPRHAYDTRAEVWLDPARHYLPVRARLSNAADRDILHLVLREVLSAP